MITTTNIEKPSHLKMITLYDMIRYTKNNNKPLSEEFLKQYGFVNPEINWVKKNYPELFDGVEQDDAVQEIVEDDTMKNSKEQQNNDNNNELRQCREFNNMLDKTIGQQQEELEELKKTVTEQKNMIEKFKQCFYTDTIVYDTDKEYYTLQYEKIKYDVDKNNFKKYKTTYNVSKYNVKILERIIRFLTTNNDYTTYRDVVKLLIIDLKLDVGVEEFNGGKNRSKYLFPYYYYPLQVLKNNGVVDDNNDRKIKLAR